MTPRHETFERLRPLSLPPTRKKHEPLSEGWWSLDFGQLTRADRHLVGWGLSSVVLYALSWIVPAQYMTYGEYPLLGWAAAFCLVATLRRPNAFPKSFPMAMVLILQLWSFFAAGWADRFLARPMLLGRPETYLIQDVVLLFVSFHLRVILPATSRWIGGLLTVTFGISAFFAWLQFMRVGPAMTLAQIYTYKPIDNWDGHPGIRAVGLTMQPNYLAFQTLIGLALVASPVLTRRLKDWELTAACFFSGATVFTQARAALPLLMLAWGVIFFRTLKHDRKQAFVIVVLLFTAFVFGLALAAKRFDYLMMALQQNKKNDASLAMRTSLTWAQVDLIFPKFPWTGIGPDSGLMLGTGPEDQWVPAGRTVESGYILFLAMYGIPGVAIYAMALLGSMRSCVVAFRSRLEPEQERMVIVAFFCAVYIAVNSFSFNTVDTYLHLPAAMLIAGMAASIPRQATQLRGGYGWSAHRRSAA